MLIMLVWTFYLSCETYTKHRVGAKGFGHAIVVVSTLDYYKVLLFMIIEWRWVKTVFSRSIIQRRRVGSALTNYKVHLYGHDFHCVLYVGRKRVADL